MRGRKPIPTHIKRLRGNPGKRPLNDAEPQPDPSVPPCPDFLDAEAQAEWRRMTRLLLEYGVVTELDSTVLAAYCQAYSRWASAERHLQQYGAVILSPDKKFPIQSPYLAIANKAMEQMTRLAAEFGMTPSARSRVHITSPPEASKLERFIASRGQPAGQGLESVDRPRRTASGWPLPGARPKENPIQAAIEQSVAQMRAEQERDRRAREEEEEVEVARCDSCGRGANAATDDGRA